MALPRRSWRCCAVGSGVPTKTRFRRCRRTRPMIPRRPAGLEKAETPRPGLGRSPGATNQRMRSVGPVVVEPVRALDAVLGAGNIPLLELLEVGDASHDVMAFRRMAGLQFLERPLRLLLVL